MMAGNSHDEALALLALAPEPVQPPAELRRRLMAAVQGPERYAPFAEKLASIFDLGLEACRELLRSLDDETTWTRKGGAAFVHFTPGPKLAGFHAGFIEGAPGHHIPHHGHRGREITMVLRGSIAEGDGTTYGPGMIMDKAPGDEHEVTVGEGETLFVLALEQ